MNKPDLKYYALTILLFLVSGLTAIGQNINATASLDSNNILIGDQVKFTYKITVPVKSRVMFPVIADTLNKSIEVVSKSKIDTTTSTGKNLQTYSQTLTITSFDSGSHVIPPLLFGYQIPDDTAMYKLFTPQLMLNVNTVAVDTTQAIKDIKPPLKEPITLREILIWSSIAIVAAVLVFIIIYIVRKLRRKESILSLGTKNKVPSHERALNALEELKGQKLWQQGKIKEYHSGLSDILRAYIEERFEFLALEMTTGEILESLRPKTPDPESLIILEDVLVIADMVKFAKFNPLPDEHDRSMSQALQFVNNTIPVEKANENIDKENIS